MLHDLVTTHRDAIITRTREAAIGRASPITTELAENGVPCFLSQLSQTLQIEGCERSTPRFRDDAMRESARRHGGELLALGFSVADVVHVYGDICQAVTKTAMDQKAPISIEEFQILNRCLDDAIAEALTEHARLTTQSRTTRVSMPNVLRGLPCPSCQSRTTRVVALRSSTGADEYYFRCNACDLRWSQEGSPNHSDSVKSVEAS
jgi:Zn finger protein HypA/HybF involved in hydrogenase expression